LGLSFFSFIFTGLLFGYKCSRDAVDGLMVWFSPAAKLLS